MLRDAWATYYFPSFSLISAELATGTTSLQQSPNSSCRACVSQRAFGELSSQQKARRNRTMSVGSQHWGSPMSTETPCSIASFLGEWDR